MPTEDGWMLFSISESGWWLIALAATVLFMVGIRVTFGGMQLPDELRGGPERQSGRGWLTFYILAPVFAAAILATNLLRPQSSSEILYLYSVAFAAIPVALFPVRARMIRAYAAQRQSPDAKVKTDLLATAWIVGFLTTVVVVAVLALMVTQYEAGN